MPGSLPAVRPASVRTQRLPPVHQRRIPERGRPEPRQTLEQRAAPAQHLPPAPEPHPAPGEAEPPLLHLRRLRQPRHQGEPVGAEEQERRRRVRQEVHPVQAAPQGGAEDSVVQGERGLLGHRSGDHPRLGGPGGEGDRGGAGGGDGGGGERPRRPAQRPGDGPGEPERRAGSGRRLGGEGALRSEVRLS